MLDELGVIALSTFIVLLVYLPIKFRKTIITFITSNIKIIFLNINKILVVFVVFLITLVGNYYYQGTSTRPVKESFNKIFNYYLTGDCENYSQSYWVAFSDKFLASHGDTDWPSYASFRKKSSIANKCASRGDRVLDIKIQSISREKFSDTAFIKAAYTKVNSSGVHHIIPENFIMKNINGNWMINVYCDTDNDKDCK